MKKVFFLLIAIIFAIQSWAQISTFPWTEGFESGLTNWTQQYVAGSINWSTATSRTQISAAQEGTNFAYFAAGSYDGYTTKLISPIFDLSALTNPTLFFYYIQPDWGGDQNTLKVYYRSDTASAWTQLLYFPNSITSWTMESITLPNASATYQIAFEAEDNYGYSNGLDNISIVNLTCPIPSALVASNPTTTGIDLGWTDATGSSWNIQYMLATETDWTNATTITGVTNPYTFTTLNASTIYKVRVQTDCGTEQSEWSVPITFATACDVITDLPWTEGFESAWAQSASPGNATAPNCWINVNKGDGSSNLWTLGTTARTGSGAATCYTDNNNRNNDWLITPQIEFQGNERLRFWAMNFSSTTSELDELSVWISNENLVIDTTGMGTYDSISGFTRIFQQTIPNGDWAQYEINLSEYSGNRRIAFVRMFTPNNGWNLRLDDVEISEIPTCSRPTNISVSNITTTDAEISWTNGNDGDNAWWLYYKPSSSTQYDSILINTNPYTLQNLNPSTEYNIYISTDCGGETSENSQIINFRTVCGAITSFPWSEGFESDWTVTTLPGNATAPDCWININNGYDSYYKWQRNTGSSYARTGTGAATMYGGWTSSSTYINSDWLISPVFTLTGAEALNFYTKSASTYYPEDISIYLLDITTNGDIASAADTSHFVRIMDPELQTTSWLFHELSLLPYIGDYRIAFVRNARPGGQYLCLDDITIAEMPLCPNTYNLTSTLRSATEVDLNWMQNGNGSGWVIAYGDTTAFDPATATQTITISSTDPVPYTVNGLTPQTPYSFAVRQNCTDGAWSNIVSVTTPAIAATLPYAHDFEDATENGSWTFINGTETNQWFIGSAADTLGANGLYVSNDAGVTNAYTVGTSRVYAYRDFEVPVGAGELELSFDWRAKGGVAHNDFLRMYLVPLDANITAGVIPPNGLDASAQIGNYTGGTGEHWLSQSTVWQHKTMRINSTQFPNLAGRTWRLLVHWRNESSTTSDIQPPAAVDNINLTVVTCPSPSALAASNITTTSALLTWQENGSATDWIIEYKPSSEATWTTYQTVSNPDSIINLMPGTSYNVRLRSLCSDTSLYSNTITFQTVCGAISVPTPVEGFLTTVPPTTCWSRMQGTLPATGNATLTTYSGGWYWNSNVTPHNAKVNIYSTGCNYWLISPSVDLGDGSIPAQIEFDVFYTAYNSTNAAGTSGTDDRFAVVVSTDDGLTWDAANATVWSNESGATRVLNNIPNTPTHIILPLFDPATTLPYTGNIKVGFYGESTTSNADNDLHIDNFEVLPYSTCQRPTSVSASNITSSDATISFTENGVSTTWEYVYGDATTVTDPTTETTISTTDNPFQLTGLTPQTQYNVWVRSICDNGNSDWSVLCTFVTEALPAIPPYTCDFESSTENLAWRSLSNSVNNWATGTAAGNGTTSTGTQANYISNDNGVSYAMNYGNIYSYTYRDIDFGTDPASYNLSFDWKCQGYQSTWDNSLYAGLIVYLRDPSEAISTSGLPANPNDNLGAFYNASTWQNAQLPVDNVSGVKRLMFVYFDQYYNYAPPAAIDNISLVQATCPRPANVAISNLTTTTADISWVHPGADSYIVSYRVDTTGATIIDEAASSSPYTIQNLALGTQYLVSVRAICSGDTTIYSTTETFTTPCADGAISSFPWTEGFENGLNCWQQEYVNGTLNWTNPSVYHTSDQPHEGSKIALFAGTARTNITKLVSPLLDISSLSTPYLSYWYILQNWGTTDRDTLRVYSRPSTDSSWTLLNTFYALDTYAWKKDSIALPNPSATYQIAFEGIERYGYGVGLDEITVYDDNSTPCAAPTNVTVPTATITNNSAIVNWTAGDQETAWQVRLDLTGTPIDVNTNSYQFTTGLTPGTNYTVYVRANCGTSYSAWVSQTFTTSSGYQLPTVTTIQENGTTQTSTTLNGSYIQGTNPILVKGFEWKESSASSWTIVPVSAGTTPFVYALNGLTANTSYDFRAYVETSQDTTRGITVTFSTLANVLPNVTTVMPNPIGQTTATLSGTTAQGTESIQARGFEYKLTSTTTWTGAIDLTATGTTTITANATNLIPNTQYDVRAYAQTLSDNRTYGNIVTFTTLNNVVAGSATTQAATDIDTTHAMLHGTVVSVGNATENIEVGFVYSTVTDPILDEANVVNVPVTYTEGMTTFSATISELQPSTSYFFKAYVKNSADIAYGTQETFVTDSLSGLHDIDPNQFLVNMYPNPANSTTNLVVSGVNGDTKIVLSDVQGRIINTTIAKAVNGKVEKTIDVNDLAKGVYYVRIQNQNTSRTQKLIVQ